LFAWWPWRFLLSLYLASACTVAVVTSVGRMGRMICGERGSFVDGVAHADVGAAAATVAVHRGVDVLIGGLCVFGEQSGGGHHLAGLAVTALRNIDLRPRKLHGMRAIGG